MAGLIAVVALLALAACTQQQPGGTTGPPDAAQIINRVVGGVQAACAFMPEQYRPAARPILASIADIGKTDPAAALRELSNPAVGPMIGLVWFGLKSVLDIAAPNAKQWTDIAEQAAGPAAAACLVSIGGPQPLASRAPWGVLWPGDREPAPAAT